MKRNLARFILILVVIAWAIMVVAVLVTPVNADAAPIEETQEDDGRIPGDDIPATERCYLTEEEVQEDYENEYITDALLARSHVIDDCTITFYCNERYPHICGTGTASHTTAHPPFPGPPAQLIRMSFPLAAPSW